MPPKTAKQPKSKQKVQEEKREEPLQAVASKPCVSFSDRSLQREGFGGLFRDPIQTILFGCASCALFLSGTRRVCILTP